MNERIKIPAKESRTKRQDLSLRSRNPFSFSSSASPVDQIMFLQRTIGNQAVQRLLRADIVQSKLGIGHSERSYEEGAGKIVDAVIQMSANQAYRQQEDRQQEEGNRPKVKGLPIHTMPMTDSPAFLIQRQQNKAVPGSRTPAPSTPREAEDAGLVLDVVWIDQLPAYLTTQIDTFSEEYFNKKPPPQQQQLLDKRSRNRNTFMLNMRRYIGWTLDKYKVKSDAPVSRTVTRSCGA